LAKQPTFELALLRLPKGHELPTHNHPRMAGALVCARGRMSLEKYQVLSAEAHAGHWNLRQTYNDAVVAGSVSSLTSERENVHRIIALEDTLMLDVFLPGYDTDRIEQTHYFKLRPNSGTAEFIGEIL
jgi:PCO_ADO